MRLFALLTKFILLLVILAIILSGLTLVSVYMALFDSEPTLTQFENASLEDIRRIKQLVVAVNNQSISNDPKQLILSERDINLGISYFGPTTVTIPESTYAKVEIVENQGRIHLTVPAKYVADQVYAAAKKQLTGSSLTLIGIAQAWLADDWINASWDVSIDESSDTGKSLQAGTLRVGAITLSQTLSRELADKIVEHSLRQPNARGLIEAWKNIHRIELGAQQLIVDYTLPNIAGSALNSYQALILKPGEQQHIAIYADRLNELPKRGPLVALVAPLFEYARERSVQSNDPVAENRAALLALAKAFGGDQLLGMLNTNPTAVFQQSGSPYTIYGRTDLAQHLVLSSGLTLVANEQLADLVGLDKELSDLRRGRTISAWDLLADKAGIRLAENATKSAKSARLLQNAIAVATRDSELLPDLGSDFSYSEDRFQTEDLDELSVLIELYLDQLKIFRK